MKRYAKIVCMIMTVALIVCLAMTSMIACKSNKVEINMFDGVNMEDNEAVFTRMVSLFAEKNFTVTTYNGFKEDGSMINMHKINCNKDGMYISSDFDGEYLYSVDSDTCQFKRIDTSEVITIERENMMYTYQMLMSAVIDRIIDALSSDCKYDKETKTLVSTKASNNDESYTITFNDNGYEMKDSRVIIEVSNIGDTEVRESLE